MRQRNYITTTDFIRLASNRLKRYQYLILLAALICGLFLGMRAKFSPVLYTSTATIYSLNSTNDNTTTSAALSLLLGSETSKSFSDESSINIVELAQSRAIREAVAATPEPSVANKLIGAIVIEDNNNHRGLLQSKMIVPKNKEDLITFASTILQAGVTATINKNNSFVLTYTGKSEDVVRVVSYAFINKISQFYTDLKRDKAKRDYEFATNKVDSLRRVMNSKDYTLIAMDKRMLFTNTDKMEYKVPVENLADDKQLIRNQYSQAVINQQTAAYKLQRDTPLIRVLDQPDPPYDTKSKSVILYSILGLIAGAILVGGLVTLRLLFRFTRQEISRALFGTLPSETTTTTASAL